MKTLEDQLSNYAAYHRDSRNIATHFVGIPLIVVAVAVLLSRPAIVLGGGLPSISAALVAAVVTAAYYLRLDLRLGALMAVLLALSVAFGAWSAAQSTSLWLAIGVGGFVAGWVIQFIGHVFEGRKPAFVDDIMGLIIGPLFVVAEAVFLLGLREPLRQHIEARVGKIRRAPGASAASQA